ncbi:MAG: hypothetical protein C4290_05720 [Chloroflexota bacterium]
MATDQPVPKPVTVLHEITAVAVAHGYTMVTGRPQAAVVHTVPGTAVRTTAASSAFVTVRPPPRL